MNKLYFLLILIFLQEVLATSAQEIYFPTQGSEWQKLSPEKLKIDNNQLEMAVTFANENEYTGSHDLRIAILEGFSHEPFHYIAGPTKKRGGPAGVILKNGYIIAQWGDVNRVDMTYRRRMGGYAPGGYDL